MTIIVKIGGSLTRGAAPRRLLARLAAGQGLVVVPGGGALADQVRAVQPQLGLSDAAAHRMALLAMEQMAHAMLDLEPRLQPARTPAELAAAAMRGAALWFPAAMTLGHADIPESWDITSDSLALWLAAEMGAERLVLVKAPGAPVLAPSGARAADMAAWTATGLVDAAFATMAVRFTGDILAVPADDGDRLDAALRTKAGTAAINEETREGPRLS
ncbi:aspartate kinase [Xanthobacter autotrophicus]|uniref:amino acid kinase family protein n=1 Tax=Xanthobacter autotrophicus TaxID=280 RepID=UPI0024A6DA6D|nr:aspartate kinase [Xanthobacter autotrophicus]MDI4655408.1 aspartate kinase [Xanthobacter autotrophicus]